VKVWLVGGIVFASRRFVYHRAFSWWIADARAGARAIAGGVELKDGGVVNQAVDSRRGCHRLLEDALPFAEDQIAGNHHRTALVALRDERKQYFGLFGALFDVADVVQNQQLSRIKPAQQARQRKIMFGGEQFLHQLIGGTEQHRVALLDQRVAERCGGVTLTHPGRAEGQQVDGTLKELATRQFAQLAIQRRLENVAIESLPGGAARRPFALRVPAAR
jgi:hypothetical protein